jgi:hypothetical protein
MFERLAWDDESDEAKNLRDSLQGMETAFKESGDLSSWSPELMHDIDEAFLKNYTTTTSKGVEAIACLFYPNSSDNMNIFVTYCADVDQVLRKHAETAPPYAREYFTYYCIWQMRGWRFPVPLGTASVVGVLHRKLKQVTHGFQEVSTTSWAVGPQPRVIFSFVYRVCAERDPRGGVVGRDLHLLVSAIEPKNLSVQRPVRHDGRGRFERRSGVEG